MGSFGRWVIVGALAVMTLGQTAAQASDAKVKVIVSDTFGMSIPGATVTLTSVGPDEKFTAVGGEAKFPRVPYGLYNLEVYLIGFRTSRITEVRCISHASFSESALSLVLITHISGRNCSGQSSPV